MSKDVAAYAELQREVMVALRETHPDWSEDVFVFYEARFAELVRGFLRRGGQPPPGALPGPAARMA